MTRLDTIQAGHSDGNYARTLEMYLHEVGGEIAELASIPSQNGRHRLEECFTSDQSCNPQKTTLGTLV